MYESITRFLPDLKRAEGYEGDDIAAGVGRFEGLGWDYDRWVLDLMGAAYGFGVDCYEVLKQRGLDIYWYDPESLDPDDPELALALIVRVMRNDRFCDGAFGRAIKDGLISEWVRVLKRADDEPTLEELEFKYFPWHCGEEDVGHLAIRREGDGAQVLVKQDPLDDEALAGQEEVELIPHGWRAIADFAERHGLLAPGAREMSFEAFRKRDVAVCDGGSWELALRLSDGREVTRRGDVVDTAYLDLIDLLASLGLAAPDE